LLIKQCFQKPIIGNIRFLERKKIKIIHWRAGHGRVKRQHQVPGLCFSLSHKPRQKATTINPGSGASLGIRRTIPAPAELQPEEREVGPVTKTTV